MMLLSQIAMYILVEIPEIMTIAKAKKHSKYFKHVLFQSVLNNAVRWLDLGILKYTHEILTERTN